MAKTPTLTDVASGFASNTTINNNNAAIEAAFENTLSRDGSAPNAMAADLDMDSNDILNVGSITADTIVVDGVDLADQVTAAAASAIAADISADEAADSASAAASSATSAASSATAVANSVLEAEHWAQYPEDSPVPEGSGSEYSAYHWAQKAAGAVVGGTDITLSHGASTVTVQSNTGADGTLNAATTGAAGAMTAADKTKLDGIEENATADMTGAEIATAYESEADKNAFTDAEKAKLAAVEDNATADQTGAEIISAIDTQLGSSTWQGGSGAITFLDSQDASATANMNFTSFFPGVYDSYLFTFANLIPTNDSATFQMRTSTDGGATYDSTAGSYSWRFLDSSGTGSNVSDTEIHMSVLVGNSAGEEGLSGTLHVFGPHLTKRTIVQFDIMYINDAGAIQPISGGGVRLSSEDVNAVRFFFHNGTVASGTVTMYGLKNSA